MRRLAVVALLGLAGCSSLDRQLQTSFQPIGEGRYVYTARYNPTRFSSDYQERTEWMRQYIGDSHLCPTGYSVEEQEPIVLGYRAGTTVLQDTRIVTCR